MRASLGLLLWLGLAVMPMGGCGEESGNGGEGGAAGNGGEGGAAAMAGSGAAGGSGGVGGSRGAFCGPEEACESEGLFCDLGRELCVECLAEADCGGGAKTCVEGICDDELCRSNADCDGDTPECTQSGCAACIGEVVTEEDKEGSCFAARGPKGESPFDSDGCSADQFIAALRKAGYDIPGDEEEAVKDNPLKRVTEGVCSAPFGNDGDPRGACELHDYCYSVCGSSRARCDFEFGKHLLATCSAHYLSGPCLTACNALAVVYTTAVATAPERPYLNNQGRVCSCCPDTASCADRMCDAESGETVDNCGDCTGELPNGSSCISDNDCGSNHCSWQGECTPLVCLTNGDCPSGICNWGACLQRGLEAGASCSTAAACLSDVCAAGVCAECNKDSGCPAAEHCNLLGSCIPDLGNNAVCTANGECLSGICSLGFCAECTRDSQCSADKHCDLFGDCKNDLGNNAACTANGECLSGICSLGFCAECTRDSQCFTSEHCNFAGDCVDDLGNGSLCTANAECRSGTCLGVCVGF